MLLAVWLLGIIFESAAFGKAGKAIRYLGSRAFGGMKALTE
jgi:hypothetical protein